MLTETSPCKYQVNASAAAACPSAGDPFDKVVCPDAPTCNSTVCPTVPSPESPACAAAEKAEANRVLTNVGYVSLGLGLGWLLLAPLTYLFLVFADGKGWLDSIKARLPASMSRGASGAYKSIPPSGVGSYGSTGSSAGSAPVYSSM